MRKTKYLKSNMNNSRLLGLKFVRALNNYSKWRRFWTSPVQVTKNLESSRLACTGIPSTTGSPKITKRSPNVERKKTTEATLLCDSLLLSLSKKQKSSTKKHVKNNSKYELKEFCKINTCFRIFFCLTSAWPDIGRHRVRTRRNEGASWQKSRIER